MFHGKIVKDSSQVLTIDLTRGDIYRAERSRSKQLNGETRFTDCVIAKACKRVFGNDANVRINRTTAYVLGANSKVAKRYELSDSTRRMVELFDCGLEIEPGTVIELRPPAPSRRLDQMRDYNQTWRAEGNRGSGRKQSKSDPLALEVRNGIYARSA